jgi:hypothetical protein
MREDAPTRGIEPESELLRAEELRKHYRAAGSELEVLSGVTLRVQRGEMVRCCTYWLRWTLQQAVQYTSEG